MIVVDKDLSQMRTLKDAFPNALIHLCLFHVLKAFMKKIVEFKLSEDDEELAKKLFRQMAFSTSNFEYEEIAQRFIGIFPSNVKKYFEDNWHNIADNWAGYCFKGTLCYGETTNNKLESKNGAIKKYINSTDNIDTCVRKLIDLIKDDHALMRYYVTYHNLTVPKQQMLILTLF